HPVPAALRISRTLIPEEPANSHVIDGKPFVESYGLSAGGATLIRPDGVIAWRKRSSADRDELEQALATALATSPEPA
ncbi:hypothetical protein PHK61_26045, partial [Actinomycetospora lutea]|nr:hypothetical protein [Actinomycetospora lutea]